MEEEVVYIRDRTKIAEQASNNDSAENRMHLEKICPSWVCYCSHGVTTEWADHQSMR